MGYEYRKTPKIPGAPECFSIGQNSIDLDEDVIKGFDLKSVLDKIGTKLLEQYKGKRTSGGKKVIGFEFHEITFTFLLEPDEEKAAS